MGLFDKLFGKGKAELVNNDRINVENAGLKSAIMREGSGPVITDPDEEKTKYVKGHAELWKKFEDVFFFDKDPENHPENLDIALGAWTQDDLGSKIKIGDEHFIAVIACAWGEYMAKEKGFEWKVLTDPDEWNFGLYHTTFKIMLYPFKSARKAVTQKRPGIFVQLTTQIEEMIASKGQ